MANRFEFRKHSCEVDIAGHKFELDCSSKMGETMKNLSVEFNRVADEMQGNKISTDQALKCYLKSIDTMLGDGAAAEIFEGRDATLDDAADVIYYLMNIIRAYNTRRKKNHMNTSNQHGKKR